VQGSSFRHYIGAEINPVVPVFPKVPAFQLLWLSSHSSFPVVPAVLSLWLSSGRSELEFLKSLWGLGTEEE
jgi:hypothetical protein